MIELARSPVECHQIVKVAPVSIDWHPGLSIYASAPFLESVCGESGWLGGFDSTEQLRCVLPYTIEKKAILRMVRFRVETITLGGKLGVEDEKAFLNLAMDFFRALSADLVIPASTNTIFRTYPDGAIAAPYGSYVVDLTPSEEDLWKNVKSSHRRQINTARKNGVEVAPAAGGLEQVHGLVRDTFKRSNIPFMGPKSFRKMVDGLGENVRVLTATLDGQVQACAVFPFSNSVAYYVYGGSVPTPAKGAMHLLHWQAMCWFRDRGVQQYDFVGARIDPEKGSKADGLKTFKERFGGRLVQGYMWKYPFRKLKYKLYCQAARFRSGGDIVDAEHHKLALVEANAYPAG